MRRSTYVSGRGKRRGREEAGHEARRMMAGGVPRLLA